MGVYRKRFLCYDTNSSGNVTDTDTENGADNDSKFMEISNNKKGRKNEKEIT